MGRPLSGVGPGRRENFGFYHPGMVKPRSPLPKSTLDVLRFKTSNPLPRRLDTIRLVPPVQQIGLISLKSAQTGESLLIPGGGL